MLIHLTPRFFLPYCYAQLDLISVEIPELQLLLQGGIDITIKKPYKNKNFFVVCRKKGKKAINGILIETDRFISDFTLITRWKINSIESMIESTHYIHYHINDFDFDAVTDYMLLWNAFSNTEYKLRKNEEQKKWIMVYSQPQMMLFPKEINLDDNNQREEYCTYNILGDNGIIKSKHEFFSVPTVERERLAVPFWGNEHSRIPPITDLFNAKVKAFDETIKPNVFGTVCIADLAQWINEIEIEQCSDKLDTLHIQILKEIHVTNEYFFTNTNDLIIKARKFSKIYQTLTNDNKCCIDNMLTQPMFSVSYPDEYRTLLDPMFNRT